MTEITTGKKFTIEDFEDACQQKQNIAKEKLLDSKWMSDICFFNQLDELFIILEKHQELLENSKVKQLIEITKFINNGNKKELEQHMMGIKDVEMMKFFNDIHFETTCLSKIWKRLEIKANILDPKPPVTVEMFGKLQAYINADQQCKKDVSAVCDCIKLFREGIVCKLLHETEDEIKVGYGSILNILNPDLFKQLVERNGKSNFPTIQAKKANRNYFMTACMIGNIEFVKCFCPVVFKDTDVKYLQRTSKAGSGFNYACYYNNYQVAKYLLDLKFKDNQVFSLSDNNMHGEKPYQAFAKGLAQTTKEYNYNDGKNQEEWKRLLDAGEMDI